MCGIAGLIGCFARPGAAETMIKIMRNRGPDGAGTWSDPDASVAFGHCRLSIIDLATGDQPMSSPDGRFTLIYNGELYNYVELRPDLERKGWTFRTASDTEVLLAGLILEGPDFLVRTNGMFAFALWDSRERRLLLARDRMGVKPLYIAEPRPGDLAFASDLKALLTLPEIDRTINADALNAWLALRYAPSPLTMVNGVRKFPAGHYAVYEHGTLRYTRYWQVTFDSAPDAGWSEADACAELESILADAVRIRLRSDVPYGAFLSGGVDSSVVVALMARFAGEPVRTYSIGFSDGPDEREEARIVGEHLHTRHVSVELGPDDLRALPDVAWHVDEPFPDPIVLAMVLLARRARQDVKVVLTGEGADELFGGYVHHPHLLLLSRLAGFLPGLLMPLAAGAAQRLPLPAISRLLNYPAAVDPNIRHRLAMLVRKAKDPVGRYLLYVSLFTPDARRAIAPAFANDRLEAWIAENLSEGRHSWIDRMWSFEHRYWLTDNILFKQDKTLMAESVEGREPFCDHRLVDFAARLPVAARIAGGRNKILLRTAAQRILPNLPTGARKKQAFIVPLTGPYGAVIREMAGDILSSASFRDLGVFDRAQTEALLDSYSDTSFLAGRQLMAVLMFGLWHEAMRRIPVMPAV